MASIRHKTKYINSVLKQNINTGRNTKETTSKNRLKLLRKLHNKKNIQQGGAPLSNNPDVKQFISYIDGQADKSEPQIAPETQKGYEVVAKMIRKFFAKLDNSEVQTFYSQLLSEGGNMFSNIAHSGCDGNTSVSKSRENDCARFLKDMSSDGINHKWKILLDKMADKSVKAQGSGTVHFIKFIQKQNDFYRDYKSAQKEKLDSEIALKTAQAESTKAKLDLDSLKQKVSTLTEEKPKQNKIEKNYNSN